MQRNQGGDMPTPRYEREIRSILEKMPTFLGDNQAAPSRAGNRPPQRRAPAPLEGWWARDAYIMAALLTIVARFGEPAIGIAGAHLLAWIAALCVVFAVIISIVRAFARPTPPKMWRGNVIYLPSRQPFQRLAAWWRRVGRGPNGRPY